jgi:opacity protein-like surface antigen
MRPLALLCLLLVVAIPATAQVPGSPLSFGIQGDLTNVNVGGGSMTAIQISTGGIAGIGGNVQDLFGIGYGGGIHVDLNAGLLSLRLQGDYITLSPDNTKLQNTIAAIVNNAAFASRFSVSGGKINIYSATLNAKLTILPLPFFQPYVTGGVGLASLSTTEATIALDGNPVYKLQPIQSQTKTAVNAGAGVDLKFGGVTLYGEVRLNFVFTDPKTTAQIPVAIVGLTF